MDSTRVDEFQWIPPSWRLASLRKKSLALAYPRKLVLCCSLCMMNSDPSGVRHPKMSESWSIILGPHHTIRNPSSSSRSSNFWQPWSVLDGHANNSNELLDMGSTSSECYLFYFIGLCCPVLVNEGLLLTWGHFTYETESPWPLHFKHSRWLKRRSRSKFPSHYAWGD